MLYGKGSDLSNQKAEEKRPGKKSPAKVYVRALDNIYAALKGSRIIDRFGFILPKKQEEPTRCLLSADYMQWQYEIKSGNWLNAEYEGTLTLYTPSHELENILQKNMDTYLE